jgi:hypothetical protein
MVVRAAMALSTDLDPNLPAIATQPEFPGFLAEAGPLVRAARSWVHRGGWRHLARLVIGGKPASRASSTHRIAVNEVNSP